MPSMPTAMIATKADRPRRSSPVTLDNSFLPRSGPKSLDRADFTLPRPRGMELRNGAGTLADHLGRRAILKGADPHARAPETLDRVRPGRGP